MHFFLWFSKSIWQYGSTNLSVPESAVRLVNCEILHSKYSVQFRYRELPFNHFQMGVGKQSI